MLRLVIEPQVSGFVDSELTITTRSNFFFIIVILNGDISIPVRGIISVNIDFVEAESLVVGAGSSLSPSPLCLLPHHLHLRIYIKVHQVAASCNVHSEAPR